MMRELCDRYPPVIISPFYCNSIERFDDKSIASWSSLLRDLMMKFIAKPHYRELELAPTRPYDEIHC